MHGPAHCQVSYWGSSPTLWEHAVQCTARNACALANLADALRDENRFAEAAENYEKSMAVNSRFPGGYDNLVMCLGKAGKLGEAMPKFKWACKTRQFDAIFCRNFGLALVPPMRLTRPSSFGSTSQAG